MPLPSDRSIIFTP